MSRDMAKAKGMGARAVVMLVDSYRMTLGLALPNACRFQPTCSCYLREAVARHGAWRGIGMGLLRLLRCHPLHPGGYDPVPTNNRTESR